MKINIKYSSEIDIETVRQTLEKSNFFIKNGYNVSLPESVKLEDNFSKKITSIVEEEFGHKLSSYEAVAGELYSEWAEHGDDIVSFLSLFSYRIPAEIDVELISYGPGGGYSLPSQVGIMVEKKSISSYLELLLHEIIHLMFEEPLVKKYSLNQLEKENLVESMFTHPKLKKLFPNHAFALSFSMPGKELLDKVDWR